MPTACGALHCIAVRTQWQRSWYRWRRAYPVVWWAWNIYDVGLLGLATVGAFRIACIPKKVCMGCLQAFLLQCWAWWPQYCCRSPFSSTCLDGWAASLQVRHPWMLTFKFIQCLHTGRQLFILEGNYCSLIPKSSAVYRRINTTATQQCTLSTQHWMLTRSAWLQDS